MKWNDERHPLYVGAVLGLARRHGLDATGEIDEEGGWTDRITIRFGEGLNVTLIVPPPAADWTLDSWAHPETPDVPQSAETTIGGWGVWHTGDEEWIGFGATNGLAAEMIPEGYDHLALRPVFVQIEEADSDRCTRCNATAWECATQFEDVGFGPMCCEDCSHLDASVVAVKRPGARMKGGTEPTCPACFGEGHVETSCGLCKGSGVYDLTLWHCRCGTKYGSGYDACPVCGTPRDGSKVETS
jgi:hypothetical protein